MRGLQGPSWERVEEETCMVAVFGRGAGYLKGHLGEEGRGPVLAYCGGGGQRARPTGGGGGQRPKGGGGGYEPIKGRETRNCLESAWGRQIRDQPGSYSHISHFTLPHLVVSRWFPTVTGGNQCKIVLKATLVFFWWDKH